MADPVVVTFEFKVTYDPGTNQFSSGCQPPPGAGPEFVWEVCKTAVLAMAKSAPYFSDPVVRENIETAAKGMKLMILGTDEAIQKARRTQANIMKELG
jgi:hypothetical protein